MTIEFGDWRLVPVDALNWELCHRHVTSRGKNAGELDLTVDGVFYRKRKALKWMDESLPLPE